VLDYTGTLKSDGKNAHSEGVVKADKLRLMPNGGPAKSLVTVDYASEYNLAQQAGILSRGEIHTGKSTVHLSGNYNMQGPSTVVHLKLNGSSLPMGDIQGLLPAVGVVLPPGAGLQGGTADTNLAIEGALDRLVTTGNVNVSNTHLTGFDLASKMSSLSFLTGVKGGSDTSIQTLSSNLRIAPEGIRADNLRIVVPSIGTMTGRGTIGANTALNFHMVAVLSKPSQGNMMGELASNLPFVGKSAQGGSLPFRIQGTTSAPIFVPDMTGMVSSGLSSSFQAPQQMKQPNPKDLTDMLGGLWGKKK
jgi:AsmA protein